VIVTGSVPDIRPYIAHATAVVAPLRIARGVQNKVLEGMAMGRTVIASSGAARGLDVRPGFDILVADVREDYVDLVNTIFAGSHTLGSNARATALRSYSWERNVHRMISLLDRQHCRYEPSDRQLSAVAQS
jgi:glycosyltransferase involved in cell wall biosynthesis